MRLIRGRVVVKESGIGIADLLVVVFQHPRDAAPEPPGFVGWTSLGSMLTGPDGSFEVQHEPVDTVGAAALDLRVVVFAPDDAGAREPSRVMFISPPRPQAGQNEEFLVRIAEGDLTRVAVPHPTIPPAAAEDPRRVIERMVAASEREVVLADGGRATEALHVDRARKTQESFHHELRKPLRDRLSALPPRLASADTFVAAGQSVEGRNAETVIRCVRQLINGELLPGLPPRRRAVMRRQVALTQNQREAVRARLAPDGTISAAALAEVIGADRPARPRVVEATRATTEAERAAALALGLPVPPSPATPPPTPPPPGDVTGNGVEATPERLRQFVARLIDTMTTPEERVTTDLEPRAERAHVEANIRDFSLPPSPADTPALHEFHTLHIAFDDVWQEVVDENLLDIAEDLHAHTLELGGDLRASPEADGDPFRRLHVEAKLALRSQSTARRGRVRDHRSSSAGGGPVVRDHRDGSGPVVRDHRDGAGGQWKPPRDPRGPRSEDPLSRVPELLTELDRRLREPYAFTVFAANRKERAVNFGLLVTYEQTWTPLGYQAGKLAKTITLAPKESRKYSKKIVVNRKRAEKETRTQARTVKEESQITSRAEQEILRKATTTTNFKLSSSETMNVGVGEAASAGSATTTTSFERDASRSSEEAKKTFHEAVFKASQEFKDELSTTVETEVTSNEETIDSGEIVNPNDAIAVTFLFYQLQRQYSVKEKLKAVTPVVLVAQEMPRPDEIDEDWVLTHDWIFRKVLLDESFRPALDYLCKNVTGDEVALYELHKNVEQQRALVDSLKHEIAIVRDRILQQRSLAERSIFSRLKKKKGGGSRFSIPVVGGAIDMVVDTVEDVASELGNLLHGAPTAPGARANPLEEAIQRSVDEERELMMRLERESTALNALTERFTKLLSEHRNRQAEIARLLVHIKANILHYMQAIWSFEPGDQRYFRLHKVRVPRFKPQRTTVRFPSLDPRPDSMARLAHRRVSVADPSDIVECEVVTEIDPNLDFVDLATVANLDRLLGYKGNYMIFPLWESNPITDLQMAPFVVAGWNELVDPDDIGNWTMAEFADYVKRLKETLPADQFTAIEEQLRTQYRRLLAEPRRDGEVLAVPTDSLFIEALPASQALLEDFKRKHRNVDVKRAQAEVRRIELENLRYAMRVVKDRLEDPDIDKQVIVNGSSAIVVPPGG